MKKLIFLLLILVSFSANSEEIELIDGRSQNLIDSENSINSSYYLTNESAKELFEIVNFKNITSGKEENIKNHRGKIVILHFWATWCGYCVDEMKSLDKLAKILEKKEIEDVVILPVSVDNDNASIIKDFYKEMNITNLSVYQDKENRYLSLLGHSTLPTTFIIGRDGKQIAIANSSVPWNNEKIVDYLKELL
jgi:thiol-disulfide isomerase/thioredoxin